MEDTHADHLQAEHGGGHRRTKQGGEQSAHATQDDEVHIPLVQAQPLAQGGSQRTADLEGRPFSSSAAPSEMSQGGAEEDQKRQTQPGPLPAADAGNDLVGAAVVGHVQRLIAPHDEQSRHRHAENQPGVGLPSLGHPRQDAGKSAPRQAARQPGQSPDHHPPQQGEHCQFSVMKQLTPIFFHHILSPAGLRTRRLPLYGRPLSLSRRALYSGPPFCYDGLRSRLQVLFSALGAYKETEKGGS